MGSDAAPIDGGTADGGELCQSSLAIESVDVVGLERSVGGKEEGVFRGDGSDCARLLFALEDNFDVREIACGAEDAAFVAVVAGQNPETVAPGIVNDVMDMANGASRKRVGHGPGCASVGRRVDVDFFSGGVVEVLSPINPAAGNGGDVQRAGAAGDRVGCAEFSFVGLE